MSLHNKLLSFSDRPPLYGEIKPDQIVPGIKEVLKNAEEKISIIESVKDASWQTIVEPLETEDFVIQPMESASPAKWHLAHTSWFFETFEERESRAPVPTHSRRKL